MKIFRFVVIFILVGITCFVTYAQDIIDYEPFISDGNFFNVMLPKEWTKHEDIMFGRISNEFGVDIKGPENKEGAYLNISIIYFAPESKRSLEAYMDANTGDGDIVVKEIKIAGRDAKTFDRKSAIFIPLHAVNSKRIEMFERKIVIPAQRGFYVLHYKSPMDMAEKYLEVFNRIVDSFKPNL